MKFDLILILPELVQILIILGLFAQTLKKPGTENKGIYSISWVPWAAAIGIAVGIFSMNRTGFMFWDAYHIDGLSQFFKIIISLGFAIATLNALSSPTVKEDQRADYFLFFALSCLGLMLLSSAAELITIYLALEIASYSLYAIIPIRGKDPRGAEAGIKYILFGAAATAIALFGLSYILASQHTTYLSLLATKSWAWADSPLAVTGITLFMVGFFFKLALFPFHFWAPDVYDGTSNETAAFAATLPKLGAVVILIRLVSLLKPEIEIITILAVLAAASMTFGNLAALVQTDIKRILGFSSVAHAGYVLVGLVAVSAAGLSAAGFYALIYLLMNLTCFWVICSLSTNGKNLHLDDLNGLYKRAPYLAFVLAVGAFALVGLPPTAGFMGKLFLLTAAWNRGFNWLIIIAALNTAISIYYYLNIVRHAYTQESESALEEEQVPRRFSAVWGGVLAASLLVLGVIPNSVFRFMEEAARRMMP